MKALGLEQRVWGREQSEKSLELRVDIGKGGFDGKIQISGFKDLAIRDRDCQ